MSEAPQSRSGLQISLKWFLIGVPILGAGLGLLGRLFYQDPNQFRLAIWLVMVVAPFLLAVGTIVRLGWRNHRRMLIAWGVLLAITPFAGYGVLRLANYLYGAHGYGIVDNVTLIKQRLPNELTTPWVWQELEKRLQSGSLSQAEVDEAIQTLVSHMKSNNPQGWNQPLHWEGKFVELSAKNQLVSQQTLFDLCDAFYGGQPKINSVSHLIPGRNNHLLRVEFGSVWARHSGLPFQLIWTVDQVLVDGQPNNFKMDHGMSTTWHGTIEGTFASGDHEIVVVLKCAYVNSQRFSSPFSTGPIKNDQWPKITGKEWQTTAKTHANVYGMNAPFANKRTRSVAGHDVGETDSTPQTEASTDEKSRNEKNE